MRRTNPLNPLTRTGLLIAAAGLILATFFHFKSPAGHFAVGLLLGLGITLELAGMYRSRRPSGPPA